VDCGLGIADCGLRIVDCGLGIGDWGLWIGDCGLRIADCGLRIVDCGLWIADWDIVKEYVEMVGPKLKNTLRNETKSYYSVYHSRLAVYS
jgi:hypothetical protein